MARDDYKKEKQETVVIRKKPAIRPVKFLVLAAVLVAAGFFIRCSFLGGGNEAQTTVLAASDLEKVLKISELSVYKVTFNGVAAVNDEEGELLYNVAYNAKVRIGFDMEQLQVSVDEDGEDKRITVTLPKVGVLDAEVDPGSLDYIFAKKSANTDDVSVKALPACKADAEEECGANDMISEQATENAVNTIKALTQPLLAQYTEYTLQIVDEGGVSYE